MNQPSHFPPSFTGAALLVTFIAAITGYFLDPSAVLSSIVATLIMVGPTALVSGLIVSRYRSRKDKMNDGVLLSVCLWELMAMIKLVERIISILYKRHTPPSAFRQEGLDPVSKFDHPLDPLLFVLQELEVRYTTALDHTLLDKRDELPWIAEEEMFAFPDFPLIAKSLENFASRDDYPWTRYIANFASRWYDTVPIQLTVFSHNSALSDIKVGVTKAGAQAYLHRVAGSGHTVVEPRNYLSNVGQALHHTTNIVSRLKHETTLPPDYIRFILHHNPSMKI